MRLGNILGTHTFDPPALGHLSGDQPYGVFAHPRPGAVMMAGGYLPSRCARALLAQVGVGLRQSRVVRGGVSGQGRNPCKGQETAQPLAQPETQGSCV